VGNLALDKPAQTVVSECRQSCPTHYILGSTWAQDGRTTRRRRTSGRSECAACPDEAGRHDDCLAPNERLPAHLAAGQGLLQLTREEECVAYAAGQRIAHRRPVVLMQSSGLGNALNALGTLVVPYRLGIPLIISMRGALGETNPSEIPIGRATTALLASLGIQAFSLRRTEDAAPVIDAVVDTAFQPARRAPLEPLTVLAAGSDPTGCRGRHVIRSQAIEH
jgi:sulfopyruvate decarboxylase TPP-binding subunit